MQTQYATLQIQNGKTVYVTLKRQNARTVSQHTNTGIQGQHITLEI